MRGGLRSPIKEGELRRVDAVFLKLTGEWTFIIDRGLGEILTVPPLSGRLGYVNGITGRTGHRPGFR